MSHTDPSPTIYCIVAALLLGLLALTVGLTYVPLGGFGAAAALTIAVVKAGLVAAFFMHLKWSSPAMRLFAAAGVVWLSLLIGGTLVDLLSRGGV